MVVEWHQYQPGPWGGKGSCEGHHPGTSSFISEIADRARSFMVLTLLLRQEHGAGCS